MALRNNVIKGRNTRYFVKEETTRGTLAFPVAGDSVLPVSKPTFEQQPNNSDVNAIRESNTKIDKNFNHFDTGSFSGMTLSHRSSGVKGTAPTAGESTLLKGKFGKQTDSSTTSVSAISISGGTAANPVVLTVAAGHGFQAGDKAIIANCTETDFNGTHVVASVTSTTITLETDGSGYGGAATDGDITLDMVRFEFTNEIPYLSIWALTPDGSSTEDEAIIEAYSGCKIGSLSTEINKEGELMFTFGGVFVREYFGGTAELSATAADSATTLTFDVASYDVDELFFVGQKVNMIDPAGTVTLDAPVSVTAVNSTANTVTVDAISTTGGTFPINTKVVPWLPTGTVTGSILSKTTAKVYLDDANTPYGHTATDLFTSANKLTAKQMTVNINQPLDDPSRQELSGNEYGEANFVDGPRSITGDIKLVARINDQKYFQSFKNNQRRSIGWTVGNTDGAIAEFIIPRAFIDVPSKPDEDNTRQVMAPYDALEPGIGVDKEATLIFR